MSIRGMRLGDTVISARGDFFTVEDKAGGEVTARDERGNEETFSEDELFCVDADDGLWQQTAN